MKIQRQEDDIDEIVKEKVEGLDELTTSQKKQLQQILLKNQEVFQRTPGRIKEYQHRLRVMDTTLYCLKGLPIPLKYQGVVRKEIQTLEAHGVIERAANPYINPMVTILKKDRKV